MAKFEDIITNRKERNFTQLAYTKAERVNQTQIRPGHFYSFKIVPSFNLNESMIPRTYDDWFENPQQYITEKQYYDLNPTGLFLYHDNWRELALVLNLKVIPPIQRAKLLAGYYFVAEKYISRLYKEDKLIPFKDRESLNLPLYAITPSVLQQITGLDLNYSINKYKVEELREIRFLDWNLFGELPYANIDESGIMYASNYTLADIFELFEEKQ